MNEEALFDALSQNLGEERFYISVNKRLSKTLGVTSVRYEAYVTCAGLFMLHSEGEDCHEILREIISQFEKATR